MHTKDLRRSTPAATLLRTTLSGAVLLASILGLAMPANAQYSASQYTDMINAQMNAMNANIAAGQQRINGMVQQRMRDPQVRSAYQQYVARARANGQQPQDYATWTYYYIATLGYSPAGRAAFQNSENQNQQREHAAYGRLKAAEAARGEAQTNQQRSYSEHQAEAGNMLRGTSTYSANDGRHTVLPHTWQADTAHSYQGNQYYVDRSGNYWLATGNGTWAPLHR